MLGFSPLSGAPLGSLLLEDFSIKPSADLFTTNWRASSGTSLYSTISETLANDNDFIISPSLFGIIPRVENSYYLSSTFNNTFTYTIEAVKPGNSLIVIAPDETGSQLSITDNKSNTYILDATTSAYSNFTISSTTKHKFFRVSNVINQPTQLILSWTTFAIISIFVFEISGLDNVSPLDSINNATSAPFSGATTITKNFITNNNNCLGLVFVDKANSTIPINTTSDWTPNPNTLSTLNVTRKAFYKPNLGAAGAKTFSYDTRFNTSQLANIVTYRPAQPEPIVFNLGTSLTAGSYIICFRATKDTPSAKIRLILTDGVKDWGISDWITITTTDSYNLYEVPVKISGTCDRVKIEASRLAEMDATTLLVSGI